MAVMNFEPFMDFESITQEMADDMHELAKEHRVSMEAFLKDEKADVEKARRVIEAAHEANSLVSVILEIIHTHPVMVHTAGPKKTETHPEDPMREGIVQRCTRCASILHMFQEGQPLVMMSDEGPRLMTEEDIPWWDEGAVIAKGENCGGMTMYEIEKDQPLKKHELECADLSGLG